MNKRNLECMIELFKKDGKIDLKIRACGKEFEENQKTMEEYEKKMEELKDSLGTFEESIKLSNENLKPSKFEGSKIDKPIKYPDNEGKYITLRSNAKTLHEQMHLKMKEIMDGRELGLLHQKAMSLKPTDTKSNCISEQNKLLEATKVYHKKTIVDAYRKRAKSDDLKYTEDVFYQNRLLTAKIIINNLIEFRKSLAKEIENDYSLN